MCMWSHVCHEIPELLKLFVIVLNFIQLLLHIVEELLPAKQKRQLPTSAPAGNCNVTINIQRERMHTHTHTHTHTLVILNQS